MAPVYMYIDRQPNQHVRDSSIVQLNNQTLSLIFDFAV